MNSLYKNFVNGSNDLLLVVGMIGILLVLFTPISPWLLDFLLLTNFSIALLVLLVTFYTEKPLSFSTFPSLLLMTTLFRLALNVSATRLILGNGDAGKVINSIGEFVVGGNYVIGLVVFLILIVVQYVVVTNGSQRVAEVAARFTLDSLPGKQMSIDADLNMGVIDHDEATRRRSQLERGANFYGAMDGASKFVKGDAVAGIVIILIDVVGGLAVGIVQQKMSWSDALHRYTLLTVGGGIITQIPSLVISVASGIIITRAATDSRLGEEITKQISAYPKTLVIVAMALLGLGIMPGIPLLPIAVLSMAMLFFFWRSNRNAAVAALNDAGKTAHDGDVKESQSVYDLMTIRAFEIRMGKTLATHYIRGVNALEQRLDMLRKQFAMDFGFALPKLNFISYESLDQNAYEIFVHGVSVGQGEIEPDLLLAINPGGNIALEGKETREPSYGLAAQWINKSLRGQAKSLGYTLVDPDTVLITHISELSKRHSAEFLSRQETERLIGSRREELGALVDELFPTILSYSDVQHVLQILLREQVTIRPLANILEVLVDAGRQNKNPDELAEKVRERLGPFICDQLSDDKKKIHALTIAPDIERSMINNVRHKESGYLLPPADIERFISALVSNVEKLLLKNHQPVLLCASPIRRSLRQLLWRAAPHVHIVSISEITMHAQIVSAGVIDLDKSDLLESL